MRLTLGLLLVGAVASAQQPPPPPPVGKPVDVTFSRTSPVHGVYPQYTFDLPFGPGERFSFQLSPKDATAPVFVQVELFEEGKLATGVALETSGIPGRTVDFTMLKPAAGRRLTVRVTGRSYGTVQLLVNRLGAAGESPDLQLAVARIAALEQQVRDLRNEAGQLRALVTELSALVRKLTPPEPKKGDPLH